MKTVTTNDAFANRLAKVKTLTAVCNRTGQVVGYYMPFEPDPEAAQRYVRFAAEIDPEELERRKKEDPGTGYTLEQILRHLQSLRKD